MSEPTLPTSDSLANTMASSSIVLSMLRPQFPPTINLEDLITVKESSDGTQRLPSRAPNAFIIYRKQFVKAARDEGYFLPMTVISSIASRSWESEDELVRAEYKRIAKEAHIRRKSMCPKSNKRRRKNRWNIVSFEPITSDPPEVTEGCNSSSSPELSEMESPEISGDLEFSFEDMLCYQNFYQNIVGDSYEPLFINGPELYDLPMMNPFDYNDSDESLKFNNPQQYIISPETTTLEPQSTFDFYDASSFQGDTSIIHQGFDSSEYLNTPLVIQIDQGNSSDALLTEYSEQNWLANALSF